MSLLPVLINAAHATGGGGLIYLQGILPHLARDERFKWTLLIPEESRAKLVLPDNIEVKTLAKGGFGLTHLWEQVVLPWWVWRRGFAAVMCNANYVPFLVKRPIPLIHTTPRVAGHAQSWVMSVYWRILRYVTTLSLLRAPVAFSVAKHVIPDYLPGVLGRYAGKVRVAYPAVNMAVADAARKEKREKNLIVTVGDFYVQKDYPTLIRAMALLRKDIGDVRLVMVGRPVFSGIVAEVRDLIETLELEDVVTMVGGKSNPETLAIVAKAEVLANTSLAECFNMPLLEALTVGTPVVCADMPFQHEVAGEGAVYVPVHPGADSSAGYAAALKQVLTDKILRERLRVAGDVQAQKFGWGATAKVIADGIAHAIARRTG